MRWHEIRENVSTTSGAIATVSQPLGMVSRSGGSLLSGKYVTDSDPTPNTPKEYKRNNDARGRFKNSTSQ